jgi:hypothetical protein
MLGWPLRQFHNRKNQLSHLQVALSRRICGIDVKYLIGVTAISLIDLAVQHIGYWDAAMRARSDALQARPDRSECPAAVLIMRRAKKHLRHVRSERLQQAATALVPIAISPGVCRDALL